jgi:hypothetical protein
MTQTLSPVHETVLLHIARGATVTAAATQAGIHRSTIHLWMKTSTFSAALEEARLDFTATFRDQFQELEIVALLTLRSLLEDSETPPAVRLRAALAVLGKGKSAPLRSCQDLLQSLQPFTSAGSTEFDTMRHNSEPVEPAIPAGTNEPERDEAKTNESGTNELIAPAPSQPTTQPRAAAAAAGRSTHFDTKPGMSVSRSAPCPCGSGRKYKRCCGTGAAPLLGFAA